MKIELEMIPLREIFDGYIDSGEQGVEAYDGRLDIRPKYQREFIYKDKERDEVIRSVRGGYPIGVMYWARTGKNEDGEDTFEVLDGQQRTLSLMEYIDGNFSVDFDGAPRNFGNLTDAEQEELLDYPVMVYKCDGTEKEKLDWFQVVNIAGQELKPQEIRNSVYTGPWLTEAKKYFSSTNGPANDKNLYRPYLSGTANRQDFLETALKWISNRDNIRIEDYMSAHQNDSNANELWLYFKSVIDWVKANFREYRSIMKGIDWGRLYNEHKDDPLDPAWLEAETARLIQDDDVTNNKGIYEYLLTGNEKTLNIRAFTDAMKLAAYEKQKGICPDCGKHFKLSEMEGDHDIPWSKGGRTSADNLVMRCRSCNRSKGAK